MRIDAVYRNARIRTMDEARPLATAFAVLHGRIVALDAEAEALAASAARVVDLGGAPVVPGFNDAHHHLSMRGQRLRGVDLRDTAVASLDELAAAVAAAAERAEPGAWIYGSGYDQNKLGGHPTAEALDRAAPANPVWLEHVSGHMGVGNTAAFERAGYAGREGVPDIDGGLVARDGDGRAEGLIAERAMDVIVGVFKPLPVDEIVENIGVGSDTALAEGITSITEPGVGTVNGIGSSFVDVHAYLRARETGRLRIRAQVMPYITTLHELQGPAGDAGFGLDLGVRTGLGDDFVKIGPMKVLTDGSLIGRSAAMRCCYAGSDDSGFMAWDLAELRGIVRDAHRLGFRCALHAIGDQAIDHVLDLIDEVQRELPREDVRHRIEHLSVASDEQIARVKALGMVAVPQGRFITELGDGVMAALGEERSALAYRAKGLLDAGLEMPGSSDSPVVEGAPLLGIHDLVNRRTASGRVMTASERITPEQALRAYTVGSAYAGHEEAVKGRLVEGMLADAVVLDADLLEIDPERIAEVGVQATVVGGELAYDAAGFASASA